MRTGRIGLKRNHNVFANGLARWRSLGQNRLAILAESLKVWGTSSARCYVNIGGDVATAYFTVGGFGLIGDGLLGLGNLRLLLGQEPVSGEQIGLRPDAAVVKGLIRRDLEAMPFDEHTLRLVEDLIAFLRRDSVRVHLHDGGFLHAKCWLFYSDRPGQQILFDRFRPILAIVGSSNFTVPGLTSNRELNLTYKVLIDAAEVEDVDPIQQTVATAIQGYLSHQGAA